MKKQDRQGVRTAQDLERKYKLGALGSSGASVKFEAQLRALNQAMVQYMAATNAVIAELSAQRIISSVSGSEVVITDSADAKLVSLTVYGPCEVSRVATANADGSVTTEAVLTEAIVLEEGDKLSGGSIIRADGSIEKLPSEDADALSKLRSYKSSTTVSVEGTAVVEVEYVADPKTYIDSRVQGGENVG